MGVRFRVLGLWGFRFERLWTKSQPVESFDVFVSHTWRQGLSNKP